MMGGDDPRMDKCHHGDIAVLGSCRGCGELRTATSQLIANSIGPSSHDRRRGTTIQGGSTPRATKWFAYALAFCGVTAWPEGLQPLRRAMSNIKLGRNNRNEY
ncbi:hypothetical protein NW759_004650 [Fusarium solani]|nr:hypothetical protein NW759_004650 [Fusarium solani]